MTEKTNFLRLWMTEARFQFLLEWVGCARHAYQPLPSLSAEALVHPLKGML